MAKLVFWTAVGLVMFTYFGYSISILVLSRVIRRPPLRGDAMPFVTFLITAYNEQRNIAAKLEQTLGLDYPTDRLEILVASDGSTDQTDEIVRQFAPRGVRLVRVEGRVGKTETQNQAVKQARGEIIIFSDATTRYEGSAVRKIVRNYADPEVGAVSGRYEYFNPTGAAIGLGSILFWKYENLIKRLQTDIRTITGCCGCIYSLRKAAYVPLPADIISDLCEPLKVLEQGYRIVFEPEAIAYEETTERTREEFKMRVRVVTRGMRGLLFVRHLFNPVRYPFVSFQLFSHKVLRWLVPIFMLVALGANSFLLDHTLYRVTILLQATLIGLALLGWLAERLRLRVPLVGIPLYFATVNAAAVVAMYRIWQGHKAVTWETVRR